MKSPPAGVRLVIEALAVLKGIKPDKLIDSTGKKIEDLWKPSLRMLSDIKFLENLITFDKVRGPLLVACNSYSGKFDPVLFGVF